MYYRTQCHIFLKYEIEVRKYLRTKKENKGLTSYGSESLLHSQRQVLSCRSWPHSKDWDSPLKHTHNGKVGSAVFPREFWCEEAINLPFLN